MTGPRALFACPSSNGAWTGNRTTAVRWAAFLRSLGWRVSIRSPDDPGRRSDLGRFDLLVALHAKKSASVVQAFRARAPGRPIVVALTGTDVYGDLAHDAGARRSIALADRLVALQPRALDRLEPGARRKTRVVLQSARSDGTAPRPDRRRFDVAVIAHLRSVKDPLLAAVAVRGLPSTSRLRVLHVGQPLEPALGRDARREMRANPRYLWLGGRAPAATRALLRRCRLLVVTSTIEGGPNVISEALAAHVPVLATAISGNVGLLGSRYPGLFAPRDARGLRDLLLRAERDDRFYARLTAACTRLRPLVRPSHERAAWARILRELRSHARA